MNPRNHVEQGVCRLLRPDHHPFYGMIVAKQRLVADPTIPTACVDGITMRFNPDFFEKGLTTGGMREIVVEHEALHLVYGDHLWMRTMMGMGYSNQILNIALDLQVNSGLMDRPDFPKTFTIGGIKTHPVYPGGPNYEKFPKGLTREEYLKLLEQEGAGKGGEGDGKGGTLIGDASAPSKEYGDTEEAQRQKYIQDLVSTAQACQSIGKLPAHIQEMIDAAMKPPQIPWEELLRRFAERFAYNKRSFARMNRRLHHLPVRLPAAMGRSVGNLAFIIDTSGSMSNEIIGTGLAVGMDIITRMNSTLRVVQCDAEVGSDETYAPGDEAKLASCKMTGRGGTDMREAFNHILDSSKPACIILFTDGYTPWPESVGVPVMVVCSTDTECPIGEVIRINE